MKNLDLANISNLDDSFSNVDGELMEGNLSAPTGTASPSTTTSSGLYAKYASIPRSSVTIAPKSSAVLATQAPTIDAPASKADSAPVFMGGGGGYSAPEESAERSGEEATIFGLKPIYAYGLGAIALGFIYFKFIKK